MSGLRRCPSGLECPVIDVPKHSSMFFHEKNDDENMPGLQHSSSLLARSLSQEQHASSSSAATSGNLETLPISLDRRASNTVEAPGSNSSVKVKRLCPRGLDCAFIEIPKHLELFFHTEVLEEEAGADVCAPGMNNNNNSSSSQYDDSLGGGPGS